MGVEVICSPTFLGTGAVFDTLSHCGKVTSKGTKFFPDVGRIVSRYEVSPEGRTASVAIRDLTSGLQQLSRYGAKLKLKREGFPSGVGKLGGVGPL